MSPRRQSAVVALLCAVVTLFTLIVSAISDAQSRAAWRIDRMDGTWTVVVPRWHPAPFDLDLVFHTDPDRVREV